jgi:L-iditol 2-dehydrogenase
VDRGVFLLPLEVSYEDGSFMEPLACVLRGQRLARLMPGQTVLVMGSGISGLLHVMLAKALGAGRVIATDISQYRLNAAENLGADAVIHAKEDVPSRLYDLNEGRLADLVIVCTGAMPAFAQALKSVDRGGTLMYFATTNPGETLPVPINDYWRNGITLLPSYGNSPYDAEVAISLIRSGKVAVNKLITHRLGLGEAAQGFQLVAGAGDSIKVIIDPQR